MKKKICRPFIRIPVDLNVVKDGYIALFTSSQAVSNQP